jgi:hypothetical protein
MYVYPPRTGLYLFTNKYIYIYIGIRATGVLKGTYKVVINDSYGLS